MTYKRVMLSSLVSMLPCSMVLCAEVEEPAFIDQRAVAAGKKTTAFVPYYMGY